MCSCELKKKSIFAKITILNLQKSIQIFRLLLQCQMNFCDFKEKKKKKKKCKSAGTHRDREKEHKIKMSKKLKREKEKKKLKNSISVLSMFTCTECTTATSIYTNEK